ncbi:uncharacterized protein EV154DRAFT_289137 [Mucor mucedo]|uniref:uncharacterized protein n=1 Tax=Mucor mucedo TaxID=29922 RepID=UPI0022204D49|nr:uncharacterized protein EV154DRAFT_289137 [Mucor mucedo]KAI7889131.1 hypothetical protein EV154DRAFT_289137 [Mucor mucedo]
MAENTETRPETPRPGTLEQIALQIKSLEQRTTSVTLPRNASVLQLKHEIQVAFDVDSNRQRLIFQGRVLKDDKNLTDYANLDNGKVIHLVIRPIDAPHNPMNDDPNPGANIRHTFNRASPNGRSRTFPAISGRFPTMEGYAFITLDSNFADLGDNQSLLSSVLNGFTGNGANRTRATTTTTNTNNADNQTGRTSLPTPGNRGPFGFSVSRNSLSELASPIASTPLADRVAAGLPFPPSVEVRLARTLGSMRNVRTMLEDSANNEETSIFSSAPNSTPEQLQEIRNRLRTSGNNQSAQIGMVLNELADLMTEAAPRMREVANSLRQENQTGEEERNTSRRVLNMSRIVQGMSLINHFLGSVLASADIDSRRTPITTTPPNASPRPPTTLPSYIFPRGNTEAIRTPAPSVDTRNSNTDTNNTAAAKPKSTLSNNTTPSCSSSNDEQSLKRNIDQVDEESSESSSNKSAKADKGKDKKD